MLVEGIAAPDCQGQDKRCCAAVIDLTQQRRADELAAANQALDAEIVARKRSEEALRESEAKYRALFEQAANAIVVFDPKTLSILNFNNEACRRHGYTREEFAKLKVSDFALTESAEEVKRHSQKVITGGLEIFETKHRTKSGAVLDIEVRSTAVRLGGEYLIQAVWRDITEPKRAEEALRESEAKLRAVFENAPFEFWVRDMEGRCILQNSAGKKHWGDRIGKRVEDSNVPEDVASLWRANNRRAFAGEVVKGEVQYPCDGEQRVYHTVAAPIRVDGEIRGILGFNIDITEWKRAEEALAAERNMLRTIVDNLPDLVFAKDVQARVTHCNASGASYLGVPMATMVGKTVFDVNPPELARGYWEDDQRALQRGEIILNREELIRDHTGADHWHLTNKVPLYDPDGSISGIVTICRNIDDRRHAEEALRNAAHQWQATFNAVGDAVFLLDAEQRICRANKAAETLLGKSAAEMEGRFCYEIAHDTAAPIPDCPFLRLRGSLHREARELPMDDRCFHVTVDPMLDAKGKLAGAVHIVSDITDRKRAENDLAALSETLNQRVGERTKALQMLHDTAVMVNQAQNAEQALKYCLQHVAACNGWSFGHVLLPAADNPDELVPAFDFHRDDPEHFRRFHEITLGMRFRRGEGLLGRVFAGGQPEWTIDVRRDLTENRAIAAAEMGIVTAMAFPVLVGQRVAAVLEFFSNQVMQPDEGIIDAMAGIGMQLGRVIERAEFEEHLLTTAEDVLRRIAQDLHDDVGQELTGLGLKAETLAEMFDSTKHPAGKLAADVAASVDRTRSKVRGLSRALLPPELEEGLLAGALERLAITTTTGTRIACTLDCPHPDTEFDGRVAMHLFRIAQEAVANAVRHGRAQNVRITLKEENGETALKVEDDGTGMSRDDLQAPGMGLRTMRYRAGLIGGKLDVGPSPNGGTQVTCRLRPAHE